MDISHFIDRVSNYKYAGVSLSYLLEIIYMSLNDYKNSIKNIVDSTNNEILLKHWKKQLEWDVQHQQEIEFSTEEWILVQEGMAEYENGDVLSLEEFINKR
jgi:hypothetical protein